MFKRSLLYIPLTVFSLLLVRLFIFWIPVGDGDQGFLDAFRSQYGIYALPIPDTLTFAGEPVPMEQYDVRERFDREMLVNTYWQSQTLLFFKRANRWFPVIEPILKEHGVPEDFKYLALIESGLMDVVSPAGAASYWQFLEGTARDYGLEVNRHVDERYHVEKATAAAATYLKDSKERYGSWTMAAAAYNIGNSRLGRILENQKTDNYYDLYLNEETARYVFRILAIKTIFSDPAGFGFHFRQEDLYPPLEYFTVEVDTTINNLPDFAIAHQTTYKALRMLNPWLRSYELPRRSGKTYTLKIPKTTVFLEEQDFVEDTLQGEE